MNFLGIIPSRYASTRFPGKPLVDILGKSMIQRVYEQSSLALDHVVVATDDQRIYDHVTGFGGNVVMTSSSHPSGTDRCAEAVELYSSMSGMTFDAVINIQGDEPFIRPDQIIRLKDCFLRPEIDIATLIRPIHETTVLFDPNKVKAVIAANGDALYFSRSPIPFFRGKEEAEWVNSHSYYLHIGMYGYRNSALKKITNLNRSLLERVESLEQLRWLENGLRIATAITEDESFGVDTPEDLALLISKLNTAGNMD
ncbi:MAG: 3-deoxy-manno-octulosonate cytidylyltransferase [Bacteroidota bacterium]|nr:3-deoxy-manno-octulosonate cytidylyltransferase [Bacteroidota bacterium]MDP4205927.1 3-deoxy-manno-octulosonate cytidylyltransferase [Bacteroidota bacterium]